MDDPLPSRSNVLPCRYRWLLEKGQRDRERAGEGEEAKGLWIHDGVLYDLKDFLQLHPGGSGTSVSVRRVVCQAMGRLDRPTPHNSIRQQCMLKSRLLKHLLYEITEFLTMTQGMDVTPLVHSHHLNRERVLQVLGKYKVRNTKQQVVHEEFTWEEDGFLRTLQRRTRAVLGDTRRDRGPTTEMRVLVWLMLLAWTVSFLATCFLRTDSWTPALVAGFFLYGLLGIGHTGMHTVRQARGGRQAGMDGNEGSQESRRVVGCLA